MKKGLIIQPGTKNGKHGKLSGRYDPFRDRNNVAFHKSAKSNTAETGTGSETSNVPPQEVREQRLNKRQLSPTPEDQGENGENDSEWSIAAGTRRKLQPSES